MQYSVSVTTAIKNDSRLFPNYYRVGFFGKGFGLALNNQQYIYSTSPSIRLTDFSARLVAQYSMLLKEDVKTLPNKPKESLEIDSNLNYMQIIAVEPYLPILTGKELSTFCKQNHINQLSIETPYYPPGQKPSEDVDKQWKSRTIFATKNFFPSLLLRHKVEQDRTELVEPLDSAIDLIASRVALLKREMDKTANKKTLQIVLQGSIMLQVNAGPLAICKVFLSRAVDYPSHKIELLKKLLGDFLTKCQFALALNARLIDTDQTEYQRMMQESYFSVKTEAEKYINLAKLNK